MVKTTVAKATVKTTVAKTTVKTTVAKTTAVVAPSANVAASAAAPAYGLGNVASAAVAPTAAAGVAAAAVAPTAAAMFGNHTGPARPKSREACGWSGCGSGLRRWCAAEQHRSGQRADTDRTSGRSANRSQ